MARSEHDILLSIIIVSYNTADLTVAAAKSAWQDATASALLKNKTELIVVDNHSTDQTITALQSWRRELTPTATEQIQLITNRANLGFAAANNQGIKQSNGKYLLLLNSDTLVQTGALEALVETCRHLPLNQATAHLASHRGQLDRLGILAATLINPDGTVQPQGGNTPTLLSLAAQMLFFDDLPLIGGWLPSTQHTGRSAHTQPQHHTAQRAVSTPLVQTDWVGGTAMLIRREVVDEIGLLDENIFMYGEDVEFCLRAKHHHFDVAIHPGAQVVHLQSASGGSENAIIGELLGYQYIWAKHKPLWQQPLARWLLLVGARLRRWLFGTITQNKTRARAYSAALDRLRQS